MVIEILHLWQALADRSFTFSLSCPPWSSCGASEQVCLVPSFRKSGLDSAFWPFILLLMHMTGKSVDEGDSSALTQKQRRRAQVRKAQMSEPHFSKSLRLGLSSCSIVNNTQRTPTTQRELCQTSRAGCDQPPRNDSPGRNPGSALQTRE
jgi:hypothetical protein